MNRGTQSSYVVFDIGNVLLKFNAREYLSQQYDMGTAEMLIDEIFHQSEFAEYERGVYTNEELVHIYGSRFPHHREEIQIIVGNWAELNTYIKESWETVRELKRRNVPIYLLSTMGKEWKEGVFKKYRDFSLFDGCVFSYEAKANKPDVKIYSCFLEKYHLDPQKGIFVDDKKENVDQAVNLGMKGIVFTEGSEIRKKLFKELELL